MMQTFEVDTVGQAAAEQPVTASPLEKSPAPTPTDGRHRADIQGLRALAVLLVVAFHSGVQVRGGFVGVDVFFVISGFVITAMLLRELEMLGRLRIRRFYTRRARRLLPALATTLVLVAAASLFILSPLGGKQLASRTGVASSLFSANGYLYKATPGYFSLSSESNPLLHTWSLAVEEQFYFVFPVFLMLAWKLGNRLAPRRSRATVGVLLAAGATLSFAISLWATRSNARLAFYASPTRAWEFCVGALLAVAAANLTRLNRHLALAGGFVGIGLIGVAALTFSGSTPMPGTAALLPVVGTALVLLGGISGRRGVTALLSWKPMVWVGDVSYGWYLWHWPVIVFARILWPLNPWLPGVLGFASLGPAYMSYRWIENPIRSNLGPRGHRTRYLAAVCILAPVAAYIALAASASSDLHKKAVKETQLAVQMHIDVQHGCDNDLPLSERVGSSCSWPAQSPEGTVLLIGDSNAGQFTEAVIEAAGHKHFSSTVATLSSCPFVDLELLTPTGDSARCHRFVTDSVAEIRRSRPSLVIIASSSTAYVTNDGFAFRSSGGAIARTRAEKAQLWEQGLASVLHGLDEAGVPVAVVHAVPHFPNFDLRMCPSMVRGLQSCGRSLTRQEVESQQRLTRSAEEQAIATAPNAVGVDFTDRLCTATHCATDRDGRFLYRDGNHLNVSGARTLVGEFSDLINRRAQKHT